jgi:AraC-like DNA-binding protein
MIIKFHCNEEENFRTPDRAVRAFPYTEYFIDLHSHDFYEVNIVLGGTGVHSIEGAEFEVGRGDVFVIPPMAVHAYENTEHLTVYHILLKKSFLASHLGEFSTVPGFLQLVEVEPFLRQNYSEAMFLRLTESQLSEIQRDLVYIDDGGEYNGEAYEPLRNHTALKILLTLSCYLACQITSGKRSTTVKYRNQILDTLEYIHGHYSDRISIDNLAERVFLSRSTFQRSFYAVCGTTPIQYLNRYRIKKAAELLSLGEMNKTDVAHFCGFYELSHMEKSIKGK